MINTSLQETFSKENEKSFDIPFLKVSQPIGDFYLASIPAKKLIEITDFDVRRVIYKERDVEKYLGIQRPLNKARVKEIKKYVTTADACFPTAVILAIQARCVEIDEEKSRMTISNYIDQEGKDSIPYGHIARVLDGQHRLAGLEDYQSDFDINVSIFVDADIADQAIIFSTVNLAQTKVSKSLAYDLFELMKSRSPQKTCHNIVITLDREKNSPFYKMIKRLGVATVGRQFETLTQATFIEPILKSITDDPMRDRDLYLRGKIPKKLPVEKLQRHPFQHMFVEEKDYEIIDIIWNYYGAVKEKWPEAWASSEKGVILNRTNGYKALWRFLIHIYTENFTIGDVPDFDAFFNILIKIKISDEQINADTFPPGSSGESKLFKSLCNGAVID